MHRVSVGTLAFNHSSRRPGSNSSQRCQVEVQVLCRPVDLSTPKSSVSLFFIVIMHITFHLVSAKHLHQAKQEQGNQDHQRRVCVSSPLSTHPSRSRQVAAHPGFFLLACRLMLLMWDCCVFCIILNIALFCEVFSLKHCKVP